VAKHPGCPKQGRFGVRMLSLIVFLQIFMRGVIWKVPAFLKYQNGMDLSPASCSNILARIGKVCQKEYDGLKERIRKSSVVYVDETSISVMGRKYWIWIFRRRCGAYRYPKVNGRSGTGGSAWYRLGGYYSV